MSLVLYESDESCFLSVAKLAWYSRYYEVISLVWVEIFHQNLFNDFHWERRFEKYTKSKLPVRIHAEQHFTILFIALSVPLMANWTAFRGSLTIYRLPELRCTLISVARWNQANRAQNTDKCHEVATEHLGCCMETNECNERSSNLRIGLYLKGLYEFRYLEEWLGNDVRNVQIAVEVKWAESTQPITTWEEHVL